MLRLKIPSLISLVALGCCWKVHGPTCPRYRSKGTADSWDCTNLEVVSIQLFPGSHESGATPLLSVVPRAKVSD